MLVCFELWQKHLRQCIHDSGCIRAEVGGEIFAIQLASLAVVFVQDILASTTKGGWLSCSEQPFEPPRRGLGSWNVQSTLEPIRAVADLDWRRAEKRDIGVCLFDGNATSTREGSGSGVAFQGSLELFQQAVLGRVDPVLVEGLKGMKDGKCYLYGVCSTYV